MFLIHVACMLSHSQLAAELLIVSGALLQRPSQKSSFWDDYLTQKRADSSLFGQLVLVPSTPYDYLVDMFGERLNLRLCGRYSNTRRWDDHTHCHGFKEEREVRRPLAKDDLSWMKILSREGFRPCRVEAVYWKPKVVTRIEAPVCFSVSQRRVPLRVNVLENSLACATALRPVAKGFIRQRKPQNRRKPVVSLDMAL